MFIKSDCAVVLTMSIIGKKNLRSNNFWSQEVKERGPEDIAQEMIDDLKLKGVEELYISIDIDVIDSSYASATGTPEPDGP